MLTKVLRYFRALPFAVLLIVATALPVMAGPFEDAVAKFANDEYSDTEEAIDALATSLLSSEAYDATARRLMLNFLLSATLLGEHRSNAALEKK